MKRLIVDRIEGGFAVCETAEETMVNIELSLLPYGTKEGSIIIENNGVFALSIEEEAERRESLFNLQESLFDE